MGNQTTDPEPHRRHAPQQTRVIFSADAPGIEDTSHLPNPSEKPRYEQRVRQKNTSIGLTLRDLQILESLQGVRYLTTPQIQSLFWRKSYGGRWGRQKACARRLRQLTQCRLVRRIEQPVRRAEPSKPYIYALDKRGAEILIAELGIEPEEIDWKPKDAEANYPFLHHLLATTDVRIAVLSACERHNLRLESWLDEKELRGEGMKDAVYLTGPDGKRHRAAVVPDASLVIRDGTKTARFFLEVDQSTVTVEPSTWAQRSWARKIRAYLAYLDGEACRARYGTQRARVLTVTTGAQRLRHLKDATEKVGGDSHFWFATFAEVIDPARMLTAPIWRVAGSDAPRAILD